MQLEWNTEWEGIVGENVHRDFNQTYFGNVQEVLHKIWLEKTAEGKDSEGKREVLNTKLIHAQM